MSLFKQYSSGEHVECWRHIEELGPELADNKVISDVMAVAGETMKRIRHNIEEIVQRLQRLGYQFSLPFEENPQLLDTVRFGPIEVDRRVYAPPSKLVAEDLVRVEEQFGRLPLSLAAFYQYVGTVDLTGNHEVLSTWASPGERYSRSQILSDPLQVEPLGVGLHLKGVLPGSLRRPKGQLPIFPTALDIEFKHGLSGGGSEGVELNGLCADSRFTGDGLPFVSSLRLAMQWGGFPGFRSFTVRPEAELRFLTDGLLAF